MSATGSLFEARRVRVGGIVQGVGFRPFVYRLARDYKITGWVRNGESGVEIHAEGPPQALERFISGIQTEAPAAAQIAWLDASDDALENGTAFVIRESATSERPTVRVSPDLPVCDDCLRELFDPNDPRFGYPYINCTNCGPRYSIILSLPYDRARTTMRDWPMCERCESQYHDPADRRFHAQPVACPNCGPNVYLQIDDARAASGPAAVARAAALLREGGIVAVKGIGGYHLACDAQRPDAVAALRRRKYRKERPFALMVRDLDAARELVELSADARRLLGSNERPIVLAPAKRDLPGVSPQNRELGVMLPYTPLHHLLFAAGAPAVLVMTSANRSSEPIAYRDDEAFSRLSGIADAFLAGEREIARRVDDSIARPRMVLRHARGYAPRAVAQIGAGRPMLCVGADLKSAVALVIEGQAFVSQHLGDLEHYGAFEAFKTTIADLCEMYAVHQGELIVVHDAHPQYASTQFAALIPGEHVAVQHHRAHVASVLAERQAWDANVIGLAFDGTGYGDDGKIWGGEVFFGSIAGGLRRALSLAPAVLPGGDAAARYPVQAAAGYLAQLDGLPDMTAAPFDLPHRYVMAQHLVRGRVRAFPTSSAGRLFDAAAAVLGFTREVTFEAQAALWLEHLARSSSSCATYALPVADGMLDWRPLLSAMIRDRIVDRDPGWIARGFHAALADGIVKACAAIGALPVVASGGVFQNQLLAEMLSERLGSRLWMNERVPCNDGGICLGQAALARTRIARG